MSYSIVSMPISSSKYSKKCPHSMTPKYITVHNTANDASARNEVSYMRNNSSSTSYHVAIDDKEVVIAAPFNRNCYHAGDGGKGTGNRKSIGIEICYSKSGGSKFDAAEKNAAQYIAGLLKSYGWGISRVKRHYDWSGKKCPHRTMDRGWQRFLNMISAAMGGSTVATTTSTSDSGTGKVDVDGRWGKATTRRSQKVLGTTVDGIVSKQSVRQKTYLSGASTSSWQFVSKCGNGSSMIRALQKLVGASVDGVAGKKTVMALQKFLNGKGFSCGSVDGHMGTKTVKAWQKYINSK